VLKVGLRLRWARGSPELVAGICAEADRLGFESVWMPEHLVMPERIDFAPHDSGSRAGDRTRDPSVHSLGGDEPQFDPFVYLAYIAARTRRIRLGTSIYLLALRHPFVAARAIQTLDVVSGGRVDVGVGAGWLEGEFKALGLDFPSRGRRLDEAIVVCRRLWSEPVIEHRGAFYDFPAVRFEPKPRQQGGPPIHVGGETQAALSRAARLGDGWIGRDHTPESARGYAERLRALRREHGREDAPFEVSVRTSNALASRIDEWQRAGVTRIVVAAYTETDSAPRSLEAAVAALQQFVTSNPALFPAC
jgi:probable F420-dependent oxidoreductase